MILEDGYVTITHDNGEQWVRPFKNLGNNQIKFGTQVYNAHEFFQWLDQTSGICKQCTMPEVVKGYMITDRMTVGKKVIVLAHDPAATQPWVTWQGWTDSHSYEQGHYSSDHAIAMTDYLSRIGEERDNQRKKDAQ